MVPIAGFAEWADVDSFTVHAGKCVWPRCADHSGDPEDYGGVRKANTETTYAM